VKRTLHYMVRHDVGEPHCANTKFRVVAYSKDLHHKTIRHLYSRSFGSAVWPSDWDQFDEFDANGAFVAVQRHSGTAVGFVLSFCHVDLGYISVVAVIPECQRQGVGTAVVSAAIRYLHSLRLSSVSVHAYADSLPAVALYEKMGFAIESSSEEESEATG
jgi:ribosomal protein S18 acetylase RimI-like enzyme